MSFFEEEVRKIYGACWLTTHYLCCGNNIYPTVYYCIQTALGVIASEWTEERAWMQAYLCLTATVIKTTTIIPFTYASIYHP